MEYEKIKDLINTVNLSSIMDFELELFNDVYIRMNKFTAPNTIEKNNLEDKVVIGNSNEKAVAKEDIQKKIEAISEPMTIIPEEKIEVKEGNLIVSPMVGTFYKSSNPDKPAFVSVGDKVKKGDIVCIIEAMKIMNEIISKFDGEIAEILVENEDMVEYGQPLFRIV